MCNGGTVVLRDRYVVQLGSSHGKNSFRVGSTLSGVRNLTGVCHGNSTANCPLMPEIKLQQHGIAAYYGDDVFLFDTATNTYSRAGVLPYARPLQSIWEIVYSNGESADILRILPFSGTRT